MKTINFEILRIKWPELAALGGFAEQYSYPDPSSSLVKLRAFAEAMVLHIYRELGLPKPDQPSLYDLLNSAPFRAAVPAVVIDKLHSVRVHGNKAAHGDNGSAQKALWLVKEAFDLARWLYITFGGGRIEDCPEYRDPSHTGFAEESAEKLKQEKRAALERLATQEAQMRGILQELEAVREKEQVAARRAEELQALISAGRKAANVLEFDELKTRRRLIDSLLVSAGWNVAPDGGNTDEVRQEEPVRYQPTETGIGYADYVLYDDIGKPLAVIEAKKTSKDAEIGKKQAELYADGIERMYGERPIIFYTNGFDVWIWDDRQAYPPRLLYGFYSQDSLQYLVNFQRSSKKPLDSVEPHPEIANRLYQLEAINRVAERFMARHRKALIVQATGTGKTRVAISLTDLLIRAKWVRRVLFLCDRRELRKQAKDAFNDFLNEPITIVKAGTSTYRGNGIYLATYPAMMKIFQKMDVGHFDLIIADESHRSIYNRYLDMFKYFDCLQVGLTATPIGFLDRNTFKMFDCKQDEPTFYYSLDQAVKEDFLVPPEVYTHTSKFLRSGIKYSELSDEQRRQLEEDGEDPELFDYEAQEVDKQIYNKDTNRAILRNLMENGVRDATGQQPGKSIVFARNHKHAMLLQELFNEMYPQYGGKFCQVIDNYDPRAEQLIDDFKGQGNNNDLTIAISVDMLDTGIDVPEVVNLVFAKPVRSKVKFHQMIGRGTRLCKNLFGLGKDKTLFRIFDHWRNFEFFGEDFREAEISPSKSIMQRLFEARLDLAETALNRAELDDFDWIIESIGKDLASLPERSIAVREKWREKRAVSHPQILRQFAPSTVAVLRSQIAPLMQWVKLSDHPDAYEFDLLIASVQTELLNGTSRFDGLKGRLLNLVCQLQMHLNPVRAKAGIIKELQSSEYWSAVTVVGLETLRKELRGIIHYRLKGVAQYPIPKVIDIADGEIEYFQCPTSIYTLDMKAYTRRVEEALRQLFDDNPTLKKIRAGEPVSEPDLKALTSLVLTQNPGVDLNVLKEFYRDTAAPLDFIIRSIVGMEAEVVKERFAEFARKHPMLTPKQVLFLRWLQNHICRNGSIEIERLYEPPFTTLDSDGLDGVFPQETQIQELISIIESFKPQNYGEML